jgi:DNA invertase Pin-like site-specific DNA recombinase
MSATTPVPAAQYVRMSTEHQQYSLENQTDAIHKYAALRGFEVIQTYSDSAKSGVILRNRPGLQQLLKDVVSTAATYRAILVYDVSRWGRFQDTDEPAHYEFIFRSAGIPVHYCAEPFSNDGTLPSLIMKALKRTMAGEFSRELGVKVLEGQKRLAREGFKQGGLAGYGLRRMLLSPERKPKQVLEVGERKNTSSERVTLVLGSPSEVECVRSIFSMFVQEKRSVAEIARELNRRDIKNFSGRAWDYQGVNNILMHPKYAGFNVFNRTTRKLYTPTLKVPRSEWILKSGAFESIVDLDTFLQAQNILWTRTCHVTNTQLLDGLRKLLDQKGRLSISLIKECKFLPSASAIRRRFGNMRAVYRLLDYGQERFRNVDLRQRTHALREKLLTQIAEASLDKIKVVQRTTRHRATLELPGKRAASILLARSSYVWKETRRWLLDPVLAECYLPTLVALLNLKNDGFECLYVFRKIGFGTRARITVTEPWLGTGIKVTDMSRLCAAFDQVLKRRDSNSTHKECG